MITLRISCKLTSQWGGRGANLNVIGSSNQELFTDYASAATTCNDLSLLSLSLLSLSHRSAIEEGKMIYYNIKNFVRFQLST